MYCDCGQVVSVLDFYFDDPSSNPAEAYSFSLKFVVKKNDFCHNKLCWISCLESGARESLVMASGLSFPKLLIQTPIWSQSIRTRILKVPAYLFLAGSKWHKQLEESAVVASQLTTWSLPIPEYLGSNLVISNFYWKIIYS